MLAILTTPPFPIVSRLVTGGKSQYGLTKDMACPGGCRGEWQYIFSTLLYLLRSISNYTSVTRRTYRSQTFVPNRNYSPLKGIEVP